METGHGPAVADMNWQPVLNLPGVGALILQLISFQAFVFKIISLEMLFSTAWIFTEITLLHSSILSLV